MVSKIFIALGSNVGDRQLFLQQAVRSLEETQGVSLIKISPVYETSPVGPDQPAFLNAVVELSTVLSPKDLLVRLKKIETVLGRKKRRRWGPREIDLDLILFGSQKLNTKDLVVPHARFRERKFVLWPLADLAPHGTDPVTGLTMVGLKQKLTDPAQSIKLSPMTLKKSTPSPAVTTRSLLKMKQNGDPIVALTAYDAPMARLLNAAGVDLILVGDSVANVKLGYTNTLPVTLDEMIHHTKAVRRGNTHALLVGDMPFLTYEFDPKDAVRRVGRLIKEGGAHAVKVEGAGGVLPSIKALVAANIPVMGHLGLTPQAVHRLGGYRVQGRDRRAAEALFKEARALESAGVFALVLEAVPAPVAKRITKALKIPTIGIGAGPFTDGQILVLDDLLGFSDAPPPKFVRPYASLWPVALDAVYRFGQDVKARRFPGPEETYQ